MNNVRHNGPHRLAALHGRRTLRRFLVTGCVRLRAAALCIRVRADDHRPESAVIGKHDPAHHRHHDDEHANPKAGAVPFHDEHRIMLPFGVKHADQIRLASPSSPSRRSSSLLRSASRVTSPRKSMSNDQRHHSTASAFFLPITDRLQHRCPTGGGGLFFEGLRR